MQINNLNYNDKYKKYEIKINLDGRDVDLSVDKIDEEKPINYYLQITQSAVDWYQENIQDVKDFAVSKLLQRKNKTWVNTEAEKETPETFKKKMVLETLAILKDKSILFYFNDSDMFYGHVIVIEYTPDKKPLAASIEG